MRSNIINFFFTFLFSFLCVCAHAYVCLHVSVIARVQSYREIFKENKEIEEINSLDKIRKLVSHFFFKPNPQGVWFTASEGLWFSCSVVLAGVYVHPTPSSQLPRTLPVVSISLCRVLFLSLFICWFFHVFCNLFTFFRIIIFQENAHISCVQYTECVYWIIQYFLKHRDWTTDHHSRKVTGLISDI